MSAYITRTLESTLSLEANDFAFILIEGMNGVGKSTLARKAFPELNYVDLKEISTRSMALCQPNEFFKRQGKDLLVDHIELVPELLNYLPPREHFNRIVLIGNLPQEQKIRLQQDQQLRIYHLLPFSQRELNGQNCEPFAINGDVPVTISYPLSLFFESVRQGFLPRLSPNQSTRLFYDQWLSKFFQETVLGVMKVAKVDLFLLFMKALAQNNMKEINHSRLAKDCRISYATAIYWTQFLLDCGVLIDIASLKLDQRRQVKRGKIIFADTGLLCHLLNIGSADELISSEHYYSILTGFVSAEIYKGYAAWGEVAPIFFYRDTAKKHVELLLKTKKGLLPIGFLSHQARSFEEQLRHMDVLRRMNLKCVENIFITDGSLILEKSDYALISAARL